MRRLIAVIVFVVCSLGAAATARAADLHVDGTTIVYVAKPGEKNFLQVKPVANAANKLSFEDSSAPITPGSGCAANGTGQYLCTVTGTPTVNIDLGDQDDQIEIAAGGTVKGGDGNDQFFPDAADGPRTLDGGNGDDKFNGDASGPDCVDNTGTASSDTMIGGAGTDTLTYQYPVTVTLDGVANDGLTAAENDNVGSDIEEIDAPVCTTVTKTSSLTGDGGNNILTGAGTLKGGGGNDVLKGSSSADILQGGDGDDQIYGFGGDDTIDGGAGNDYLEGGAGDDVIDGGPGTDTFYGDLKDSVDPTSRGFDTINSDDGIAEAVNCGVGNDIANLDAVDTPIDCEAITRSELGALPAPTPTPSPSPTPAPAPKRPFSASAPKLASKGKQLKLRLTCVKACSGKLTVKVGLKTVASKTVKASAGKPASLTLSLSATARKAIKQATKRKQVTLTISFRGATEKLTLKP